VFPGCTCSTSIMEPKERTRESQYLSSRLYTSILWAGGTFQDIVKLQIFHYKDWWHISRSRETPDFPFYGLGSPWFIVNGFKTHRKHQPQALDVQWIKCRVNKGKKIVSLLYNKEKASNAFFGKNVNKSVYFFRVRVSLYLLRIFWLGST